MTQPDTDRDAEALAARLDQSARRMELADPDAGLGRLDRAINRVVEAIGVLALVLIVGVVFANASARYLLNFSFTWAEELVQMTIPWLAMSGVFLSVRRGTVIRIDFFYEKMPARLRPVVARAGLAFNCLVLAVMAYVSFDFVRLFGGDKTLYVGLPTGVSTSALVFGAAGVAMAYAAAFVSAFLGRTTNRNGHTP
ncbi:TRAP transporter - DctQ subunit (plasmid) [Dinoroseobacter shibae DFL 12 = DSM 16493]|jgi:TRAP-type C4-dicarboxylate transport system permease small subunit|uniref:TRAP transporter small permease protein n=1 Tax=Dinoroseobacter shibae (strain DSM 16493 / NCIMB 14021 / DFL 12) TaxID=398580 RepID=A8LUI5_DINSH|nr:TRAP transporter small permease [Dinoroseobacter shibae]ABV95902.1 TRAP transporter - DctQ subunit [Dinoroseobacter shibae DFL 12 = DSM 16493]URF49144.1 TRAP transporter small permease [Dinoroseobacter shibae]URF53452.1 TRAP transporter small permease [Dinoroseobacter shibae]